LPCASSRFIFPSLQNPVEITSWSAAKAKTTKKNKSFHV